MPKVLLIEDEDGLSEALEYQLSKRGYEVERSADGIDGLRRFHAGGADLVLLDLMLPSMAGEDVCKEIRKVSTVPIIMLTAKEQEIEKVLGFELGADDYITKPFSTAELLARVKALLRRASVSTPTESVLEVSGIRLDVDRYELTVRGTPIHLTRKEFDVLRFLMERQGRVVTRETLIENVWGSDYFGDTRTLDQHVKRLRDKIEPDPRSPRHLITLRSLGYKFLH